MMNGYELLSLIRDAMVYDDGFLLYILPFVVAFFCLEFQEFSYPFTLLSSLTSFFSL